MKALRDWWLGPSHPELVKEAYQEIQDNLARDDLDASFGDNFRELKRQQAMGAENPYKNWKSPDDSRTALERWKRQIDAMVTSGNPVLQKHGMDSLRAYNQRATAPEAVSQAAPSTAAKMAAEMGLRPGTPEWNNFIQSYAFKSNRQYAPKYITPAEAKSLEWLDKDETAPLVGQDWELIRGKVRVKDDLAADRESAGRTVDALEAALFNEENGIYLDPIWHGEGATGIVTAGVGGGLRDLLQKENYKSYSDVRAGSAAPIIRALGEKGALSDKDIERALALLPNISGVRGMPDLPHTAKQKFQFLRMLLGIDPKQWPAILDQVEAGGIDLSGSEKADQAGGPKPPGAE